MGGKPYTDLLVLYRRLSSEGQPGHACGFGYQKMIDWYAALPHDRGFAMGFELDTGSGQTDRAGIYFQQHRSMELVEPFLRTVGEEKRAA